MKIKKVIAGIGMSIIALWIIYSMIYTPIVDFFPRVGYWIIPIVILAWIGWIIIMFAFILFMTWAINILKS